MKKDLDLDFRKKQFNMTIDSRQPKILQEGSSQKKKKKGNIKTKKKYELSSDDEEQTSSPQRVMNDSEIHSAG